MTVREYIGARYVPLFMGEWDNTSTYEPLSIVQYQGNSYTSRQYVPTGIEITNTAYWAETGNYNAQVEQYRTEVLEYSGQIQGISDNVAEHSRQIQGISDDVAELKDSELEQSEQIQGILNDVAELKDSEMAIYTLSSKYGLTLVQVADKNIVFECGSSEYPQDIITFFATHQVTHIDVLVITHYHFDHYSGFATVANYCDNTTDIYVQMEVPNTNDDYSSYVNGKNFVDGIITSNGLKNSIVPINNVSIEYDNVFITFYNTDVAYSAIYEADDCIANTTANLNINTPDGEAAEVYATNSINNYSLVTRIEFAGNTYINCGDIEGEAQRVLANLMQPANVMSNPHHLVNRMGYLQFFNNINPDAIIATHNTQGLNEQGTDVAAGSFFYYYIFRYLLYSQNDTKFLVNLGGNVDIILKEGEIKREVGGKKYSYYSFDTTELTVPAILPPNYYDKNPYILFVMSIDDFWNIKVAAQFYPKFTFKGGVSSSWSIIRKMQFMIDLKNVLAISTNYSAGQTLFIDFIDLPKIKFHSTTWNYNIIELMPNFNMSDFNNGVINYKRYSFGDTPIAIEGTWNENTPMIVETEYAKINNAEQIIAIIDLGVADEYPIPMNKINGSPLQGNLTSNFSGTTMNTAGTAIYFARITNNGNVVCNRTILSSGTVTPMTIKRILVVR